MKVDGAPTNTPSSHHANPIHAPTRELAQGEALAEFSEKYEEPPKPTRTGAAMGNEGDQKQDTVVPMPEVATRESIYSLPH